MKKVTISTYLVKEHARETDIDMVPWAQEMNLDPIKDNVPEWFKKLPRTYNNTPVRTLKFCPSFINFFRHGYVVKNQADIRYWLDQNSNLQFESDHPKGIDSHVDHHQEIQFGDDYPFMKNMIPASLKFLSPFSVRTNKETQMLVLPCWWSKSINDVHALHGLIKLSTSVDFGYHINTFIRRPYQNEVVEISAGTPVAHIFFIDMPEVTIKYDQSLADTKQGKFFRVVNNYHNSRYSIMRPIERIKKFLIGKGE